MTEEISLEAALKERLQTTIKTKQGNVAVDENGQPITAMQAIAMSILQNAMKGDIPSATFIRNITRTNTDADEAQAHRRQEAFQTAFAQIRRELEAEGLYLGQDIEIEKLAHNMLIVQNLNEQMQQPDYEDVIREMHRDGSTAMRLNPLHEWRDRYQKQLLADLKELRTDALRRKINIRNKK